MCDSNLEVLIEIVRSPAKVTWLVNVNGITVATADTKNDARVVAADYAFTANKNGFQVYSNEV